jgi:hypothetical protein
MRLEDFDSNIKNRLIELVNGIYTDEDLINELQSILVEYELGSDNKGVNNG